MMIFLSGISKEAAGSAMMIFKDIVKSIDKQDESV